jgi:hypothetical protein
VDFAMHSAPAVTYPVGRSRLHGGLLIASALISLLVGLVWRYQGNPERWRLGLYALIAVGVGVLAIQVWRRTPQGDLRWDGQTWNWSVGEGGICGTLAVHVDLQFCMVLSLRLIDGGRVWLWPERSRDPACWDALRRAVVSHGGADQSGVRAVKADASATQVKS